MSFYTLCTYVWNEYISGCFCESVYACIFKCDSWALCLHMHTYMCESMHMLLYVATHLYSACELELGQLFSNSSPLAPS